MEQSDRATTKSAEISVNFVRDDDLVPEPKKSIATTDEQGRAPRNHGSRRIQFLDDGKLFEGHFTVQSTNLKNIIQYLLDRHSEQDVVIQDLQKQVHTLRSRSLKSNKRGDRSMSGALSVGGGAGDAVSAAASSDLAKRLKKVEQFLQLWGVRLSDVTELVEEYGDPTITPDAYTSYLLDLPAFRLTRREARALLLTAGQPSAATANAAVAGDTATRRRNSSTKREATSSSSGAAAAAAASSSSPSEDRARLETPEKRSRKSNDAEDAAHAALEKATAVLERAEALMAELQTVAARGPAPAPPKPRRAEVSSNGGAASTASASSAGGTAVDAEARADIEELGEYVMQRFHELEARTNAMAQQDRNAARQASEAARARENAAKKGSGNSPAPPPLPPRATVSAPGRGEEVVDVIAREDAAASLDLLEELETTMERRFTALNSALANISARTSAIAKATGNNSNNNSSSVDADRSRQRHASPVLPAPVAVDAERRPKEPSTGAGDSGDLFDDGRAPPVGTHTSPVAPKRTTTTTTPNRKPRQGSGDGGALVPALVPPPAILVDQAARDETAALSERVSDLEEELLDRWQAMEERLRIIGRAAMKQGVANTAGGGGAGGVQPVGRAPAVDRKAREDAALSLMRLQQVEKDLALLKRQAASLQGSSSGGDGGGARPSAEDGTHLSLPTVVASPSMEPAAPLRDTYGSKVADLEKEVEQRMAEVNQAIAQLRGIGSSGTPLTLSPQKRAKDVALIVPVPPTVTAAAQPERTAVAVEASQLTLRAEDADHVPVVPAAPPQLLGVADDRRRAAAQQSVLNLGYDIDIDSNLFSEIPRAGARVGGRRTTVSRLRSPDAPPFGTHLVQREVVDIPLVTAAAAAAAGEETGEGTAATPVHAVRRVSNVKGDLTSPQRRTHSISPPRGSKVNSVPSHVSVS